MENETNGIAEIFCINLKPGTGADFNKIYIEQSLPLQRRWKVDILSFGPSLHDQDSYLVIRRYKNLADRLQSQDSFYGSDEWKQGPREAILALIENYTTVVVPVNAALLAGLQQINLLSKKGKKGF
jgi:hypothetical protein